MKRYLLMKSGYLLWWLAETFCFSYGNLDPIIVGWALGSKGKCVLK
jgi:hypothetical protein